MIHMILFDLSIYSAPAIHESIMDFHDIAIIKAEFQDNTCRCNILDSLYDTELTEKEFENYVLDKTVSKEREG